MDITIPFEAQLHLDRLIYELQAHYYALKLCVEDSNTEWEDVRNWLIFTRVVELEETVCALRAFGDALGL